MTGRRTVSLPPAGPVLFPEIVPDGIEAATVGYAFVAINEGCSPAHVYRLEAPGRPALFLKAEDCSATSAIDGEATRLRWLRNQGIRVPSVIVEARSAQHSWLLMSAVPGSSLAGDTSLNAEQFVSLFASALSELHSLNVRSCPFSRTLERRLSEARSRVEEGAVSEDDFDEERRGRTAWQLYEELIRLRPHGEDLVVTHGDATAENLLVNEGQFSGFVDCGGLGLADRYQDLALACREIGERFGPEWIVRFFEKYGTTPDQSRIAYYQLLDEFF